MVTPAWVHRPGPGPRMVHVNATATGGGVAELLHGLVPAQTAAGQATGWAVIAGDEEFFAFTKRLHHLLHGRTRTGTVPLPPAALPHYRSVLAPQSEWLASRLSPGDVVVLHDPQTLGMAPALAGAGLRVVWHCHIGTTRTGTGPAAVWRALATELSTVDTMVTTLPEYAPPSLPASRLRVVAPAIDPSSAKNRTLSATEVAGLLDGIGLTGSGRGRVEQDRPLPPGARMVLQVSRWDPLKDMPGVVNCLPALPPDVHLVLAGNDPDDIPDDPEGRAVLDHVRAARAELSERDRARLHLVLPSAKDGERAALVVNALQRRADVVLQKSLEEGFGLTVTEAMAKGRAVVAAAVGGLRRQIRHGHDGMLVNPRDLSAVATAARALLDDPLLNHRIGENAADTAARRYLMPRLVADYRTFATPGRVPRAA